MGPADQRRRVGVITTREIALLADEWRLAHHVVEKDYVLGWLLAVIAEHPQTRSWAFKGGTCLRKCWFETYRFSEDLDFTVAESDLDTERLRETFMEIAAWLKDRCGLGLIVEEGSFRLRKNKRGNQTIVGRLGYLGPLGMPTPPKVKLDLTADEVIVRRLEQRPVMHPFSDTPSSVASGHLACVVCYSLPELLGEKMRALAERGRPRDLYDVVHTYRHPDLIGRADEVAQILASKCAHAGIDTPTLATIRSMPFRDEIETEWSNMLGHQLPHLPSFDEFWAQLDDVFAWLAGTGPPQKLTVIPPSEKVTEWRPARHMTSWQQRSPIELIRFAGANRLKVTIDYHAVEGRVGPRTVEPYSLRRSQEGKLLVFVVNDRGALRSYRADRIRAVSIESETFTPRYIVEF